MSGALGDGDSPPSPNDESQHSERSSTKSIAIRFHRDDDFDHLIRDRSRPQRPSQRHRQSSIPTFRNVQYHLDENRRKSASCINSRLESKPKPQPELDQSLTGRRRSSLKIVAEKIRIIGRSVRRSISGHRSEEEVPVWTDRFEIKVPEHISKDLSELEYLRRRNRTYCHFIFSFKLTYRVALKLTISKGKKRRASRRLRYLHIQTLMMIETTLSRTVIA